MRRGWGWGWGWGWGEDGLGTIQRASRWIDLERWHFPVRYSVVRAERWGFYAGVFGGLVLRTRLRALGRRYRRFSVLFAAFPLYFGPFDAHILVPHARF